MVPTTHKQHRQKNQCSGIGCFGGCEQDDLRNHVKLNVVGDARFYFIIRIGKNKESHLSREECDLVNYR